MEFMLSVEKNQLWENIRCIIYHKSSIWKSYYSQAPNSFITFFLRRQKGISNLFGYLGMSAQPHKK